MTGDTRIKRFIFFLLSILIIPLLGAFLSFSVVKSFAAFNWIKSYEKSITFYVIGGSTSIGLPYFHRPSFIQMISDKLNEEFLGHEIKIENFAHPGKTIFSNLFDFLIHTQLYPVHKSYTFIYTGINEVITNDNHSGLSELNELEAEYGKSIVGLLYLLYLYPDINNLDNFPNGPDFFRTRLKNLLDLASDTSEKVFISSIAGNFHGYEPRLFIDLSCRDLQITSRCEKSDILERSACFNSSPLKDIEYANYQKLMGLYHKTKDIKYLDKISWTWDFFGSLRPSRFKNKVIKELATKYKNVVHVPFLEKLKEYSDGYIGYNLFFDAHHPKLEGYVLLANEFLKSMGVSKKIFIEDVKEKYNIEKRKRDVYDYNIDWLFYVRGLNDSYIYSYARRVLDILKEQKNLYNEEYVGMLKDLIYATAPTLSDNHDELLLRLNKYNKKQFQTNLSPLWNNPGLLDRVKFYLERNYKCNLVGKDLRDAYLRIFETNQEV